MKQVGILSMQRIKNYGSFLQAYALKRIIESLGYEVQFVDYKVESPLIESQENGGKISKGIRALKGGAKFTHKLKYVAHKRAFEQYFGELGLTEDLNFSPKLDTLVIGSDEVFNVIQANKNVGYSLELFGKNNNANRVITYAASFGNTTLDKISKYGKKEEIGKLLKEMDAISVRDKNSYDIVEKLTGGSPNINLDPVLIFDYMHSELVPNIHSTDKYMLLYAYNGRISEEEAKKIKEKARARGLKLYSIGGAQPYADKFIDCSPFEVLAYFKNAESVVTDTFHGSIFSIINEKPFVTLVRKSKSNSYGNEEKLTYLLESLHLKNRIIYNANSLDEILFEPINYASVNEIIKMERQKAVEYLRRNL